MLVQVETGQMSAAETGQMSAVETRQMLKSQIRGRASKQPWGLSNPRVVIFTEKKASAASFLAATGLVRPRPKVGPNPNPELGQNPELGPINGSIHNWLLVA